MDYSFLKDVPGAICKPEPREKTKAREDRKESDRVHKVHDYVFGRERHLCRICRLRNAESMHELRFKSLGGKVSRANSIAACGSGTTGCHGFAQRHEIEVEKNVSGGFFNADMTLRFRARTPAAAEWLRVQVGQWIESPVMLETEISHG